MKMTPLVAIGLVCATAVALFFRDVLRLSISRPGRRFDLVHPWEKWLHPAKPAAVALWCAIVWGTDLDRPLSGLLGLPREWWSTLEWCGAGLASAGIAFACWGRHGLGGSFASRLALHERHALVVSGPYRITRHPIYTGVLCAFWGLVLAADSVAGLAIWGGFFTWMIYMHTVAEEHILEQRFGESYRAYRSRVPRLVPLLPPV